MGWDCQLTAHSVEQWQQRLAVAGVLVLGMHHTAFACLMQMLTVCPPPWPPHL